MRTSTVLLVLTATVVPVLSGGCLYIPEEARWEGPVVDTNLRSSLQQRDLLTEGSPYHFLHVIPERRADSLQYQMEKLPPGPRRKGLEIM